MANLRRRNVVIILAVALVLAASAITVWRVGRGEHRTAGEGATTAAVRVVARTGADTTFRFLNRRHHVRLLAATGRCALVRFSSAPTTTVLSATQPEAVDLTGDTFPDATASLATVAQRRVTIVLSPIPSGAWDETGFQTSGGLRPWDVVQANGTPSPALVRDGRGGLMLFTISANRRVAWQRFTSGGGFVASPRFGAGILERQVSQRYAVSSVDAVAVPGGFVVATGLVLAGGYSSKGVALTPYDADLRQTGPALHVAGQRPRLAYDGQRLWLASTDGRQVSITHITAGTTLSLVRTLSPIAPPSGFEDGLPAIAVDPATGDLVLAFGRSSTSSGRLHLAVVDPASGTTRRVAQISSAFWRDPVERSLDAPEVLVGDGTATVQWRFGGPVHLYTATVTLASGAVVGRTDQVRTVALAGRDLLGESRFVAVGGTRYLLGLVPAAKTEGSLELPRYVLFRLGGTGFESGDPVLLDGGFPVRADILVERSAWRQVPDKAVAGASVVLETAVLNRGTQSARGVAVDLLVNGAVIATVNLGTLAPFQTKPVAVGWAVPADTAAEQLPARVQIHSASAQYTTDNDAMDASLLVLQKGLINGFVIDDSADVDRTSMWSTGLADARVTIGDIHLTTNLAGFFRVDDLAFGTYQIRVTKPGYRTVGATVELKRTRPFGVVALHTDDHGILEVRIVDGAGAALDGAKATIVDARRQDITDSSGVLRYDISQGTYRLAATKRGHTAVADQEATVDVGRTTVATLVLPESHVATATGKVVDQRGDPVPGATVEVVDYKTTDVVQTLSTDAEGSFGSVEVAAEPTQVHQYVLRAHKAGIAYTATDSLNVYGGDVTSSLLALVPDASGELHGVSASEGYTSWMIHEGFPGFASIPGADMYVWFGNYGIKISGEYWDATHELVGLDVSVQGNSYESHATKSEIDFTEMQGSDFNEMFETTEIPTDAGGHVDVGGFFLEVVKEHGLDLIDLAGDVRDLFAGSGDITDLQDKRLITWKEGKEDFRVIPEFDSSDPIRSVFDIVTSLPTGFAIPVVIGGSSVELTSVRVDQVDVVDAESHAVLWSSESSPTSVAREWFSWQGPDGATGVNTKRYTVTTPGIDVRNVLVEVFLNVGKIRPSSTGGTTDVYGTSFGQREQQVIIFRPATKAMVAQIAPGDLYRQSERIRINT